MTLCQLLGLRKVGRHTRAVPGCHQPRDEGSNHLHCASCLASAGAPATHRLLLSLRARRSIGTTRTAKSPASTSHTTRTRSCHCAAASSTASSSSMWTPPRNRYVVACLPNHPPTGRSRAPKLTARDPTGESALPGVRLSGHRRLQRDGSPARQAVRGAWAVGVLVRRAARCAETELAYALQRLKEWLYKPYERMIKDHPHVAEQQPFRWVQVLSARHACNDRPAASRSRRSTFRTTSRRYSLSIFQRCSTGMMDSSTPA